MTCRNGHPRTPENTVIRRKAGAPYRRCRLCELEASRRWRTKNLDAMRAKWRAAYRRRRATVST
jgi:phosphoribosyl-dephospho-CoA transferase